MKPLLNHVIRDHVMLGVLASLSMLPFYGWTGAGLFFLANIFIDLDHYVRFLRKVRFRYWSPRNMFRFFDKVSQYCHNPEYLTVEYFHTVEVFLVLGWLAGTFRGLLVPFFAGLIFHEIVDLFHLYYLRLLTRRCCSLIEYGWRIRQMKKRGLDPQTIYREAAVAAGFETDGTGRTIL